MPWRDATATIAIALVTAVVSLAILATGNLGLAAFGFGFIPLRLELPLPMEAAHAAAPVWITPLTATLVHGGFGHLALNLVMLLFCGIAVERVLGWRGVTLLYFAGAYTATLGHWAIEGVAARPMIGASGAISAFVGAYALLFGRRRAGAVGPIPGQIVHVAWLAAAWIGIQLLVGFAGGAGMGSIAIGAHIGGFIVGLLLARPLLAWRYRRA